VLLDIGSVLGGIGLAVVGFIVVILVCLVILRLLAAILPSYEDRAKPAAQSGEELDPEPVVIGDEASSEEREPSSATGDEPVA
jgi:hypothetical protein